ncbi:ArsR/SmtB family transcription factor [Aldersonia kunmingensis]|uniref:ArsR/SmtB family transcription factor n=1 Tax=Aldersonia kunmingensis TaxID=408066 RepID=UPI000833D906|nr:metalloregulator ArsR/SmtB family transcription factor [Aldersonia kunmingensis]
MAEDQLSATFAALADPTRRAILARLADGEATVTELAEPFEMSLPAISKHLKVLERAGLISRGREAQWRPCRLEAHQLVPATDWLDGYRRLWESKFDALDDHLRQIQGKGESS